MVPTESIWPSEKTGGAGLLVGSTLNKEGILTSWIRVRSQLEQVSRDLELYDLSTRQRQLEREKLQRQADFLSQTLATLENSDPGLIPFQKLKQLRAEKKSALKGLSDLKVTEKERKDQLQKSKSQLATEEGSLRTSAGSLGLNWQDALHLALAHQDKSTPLQARSPQQSKAVRELQKELKADQAKLERFEELYTLGGLPLRDIEAFRLEVDLKQERLKVLQK